jgi:MerR family transcriptional regulator, light-induced transcriptional regulator
LRRRDRELAAVTRDSASPADESGQGRALGIKAVSELLGVPAPTIRSWERRYALLTADRSAGGHRLYREDDLVVLRRMRDEVAQGRAAVDAAAIASSGGSGMAEGLRDAVLTYTGRLDGRAITATLDRARALLGLERTVDDVLMPAMREIGRLWSIGERDVAHEHAATAAIHAWLGRVRLTAPPPSQPGSVVLACGPHDAHTLALDCLAALLEHRGVDCRLLAARTPADSLVLAVQEAKATAAVVVSYLARYRPAAVLAIRGVAQTPASIYYAGAAFQHRRSRLGVPGIYLGDCVSRAADDLLVAVAG